MLVGPPRAGSSEASRWAEEGEATAAAAAICFCGLLDGELANLTMIGVAAIVVLVCCCCCCCWLLVAVSKLEVEVGFVFEVVVVEVGGVEIDSAEVVGVGLVEFVAFVCSLVSVGGQSSVGCG